MEDQVLMGEMVILAHLEEMAAQALQAQMEDLEYLVYICYKYIVTCILLLSNLLP